MQAASFAPRKARTHYRHELRTLTYVTIDEANGGIIRNLNRDGVAVQAVAPLRPQQRVRLRFELRFPRLSVETYGQVSWASSSGQCGVRFVDLPERTSHQIDEWIFANLLAAIARDAGHPYPVFGASVVSIDRGENARDESAREENIREESFDEDEEDGAEDDGLTLSPAPHSAIRLETGFSKWDDPPVLSPQSDEDNADPVDDPQAQSWLSRPLAGRTLSWLVDGLIVLAGLLLFALIFLSIVHELPPWPVTLGTASAAAVLVAAGYWALFALFGGSSLGNKLAQATSSLEEEKETEAANRFR